jgi:hypothetical protein
MDTQLYKSHLQVERKHITLELKENLNGTFLRITEEVGGRCNRIVIPATGLEQFRDAVNEMIRFHKPPAGRRTVLPFWPWKKAGTPGPDGSPDLTIKR